MIHSCAIKDNTDGAQFQMNRVVAGRRGLRRGDRILSPTARLRYFHI